METLNQFSLETAAMILGLKKSQIANIRNGHRELSVLETLLLRESHADPLLSFFNWHNSDRMFWSNVEELQYQLKYNDFKMAKLFSVPLRNYRQSRAKSKSLSWRACESFNTNHKVHPALWLTSDLDIECIVKNMISPFKSNAYLPKRVEGGGSRMLTLANLISYVQKEWGDVVSDTLMSSLQITKESLKFERNISIQTFSDFHKKMRAFGAEDHHYEEMGANNKLNSKKKRYLSQKIPSNLKLRHQVMIFFTLNLSSSIDDNRTLEILSSSKKEFIVKSTPTKTFLDSYLPGKPFAEYEIALYIKGHARIVPTYFDHSPFREVQLDFDRQTGQAIYSCLS